jgi:FixJ family two-component response regulator
MAEQSPVIFIVDDEPICRRVLEASLRAGGYTTRSFDCAEAFLAAFKPDSDVGCILLDMNMPGMSGFDLQCALEEMNVQIPILFISATADVTVAMAVMKHGAVDIIKKPIDPATVCERVRQALESTPV